MAWAFKLNDVEEQRYEEFKSNHCGQIEVIFHPGGIGTNVYVKCLGCGESLEISDYDSW